MARRVIGLLVAVALAGVSGFAMLVGTLWGFTLKCDDSCSVLPPWRNDPEAWQWEALGWASIAVFVGAALFVGALAMRWRLISVGFLAASASFAAWFLTLLRDSGLMDGANAGPAWVGLAVCVLAGLAAVAVTPRRAVR
jgi:hypothetical protein